MQYLVVASLWSAGGREKSPKKTISTTLLAPSSRENQNKVSWKKTDHVWDDLCHASWLALYRKKTLINDKDTLIYIFSCTDIEKNPQINKQKTKFIQPCEVIFCI